MMGYEPQARCRSAPGNLTLGSGSGISTGALLLAATCATVIVCIGSGARMLAAVRGTIRSARRAVGCRLR